MSDDSTPGPSATPEQDADVRALLGLLRDGDVPMPDDVARRIDAAIRAEQAAATLPDTVPDGLAGATPLLDEAERDGRATGRRAAGGRHATVSVLPTGEERRGGSSYRTFTRIAAVAASVVILAGGAYLVRGMAGGSNSLTSAGGTGASTAADAAGGAAPLVSGRVSTSGTAYTQADLAAQALALATGASVPEAATGGMKALDASPAPSGDVLDACVAALTGTAGVTPVAIDSGTYDGQPAYVVIVPAPDAAGSLDVWVVAPSCGTAEPTVYEFQRLARP